MSEDHAISNFATGVAPGDENAHDRNPFGQFLTYCVGLGLAAVLTIGSFLVASEPGWLYGPGILMALAALAIAQMGVHLAFFLHITTGPDNVNNVMALAFGVLIVGFVIAGSLWIMHNMDSNMMLHDGTMMPASVKSQPVPGITQPASPDAGAPTAASPHDAMPMPEGSTKP